MVEEVEVEEMKEVLGGEEEGNSYNISEGKSAGGMGRTVGGPPSCPRKRCWIDASVSLLRIRFSLFSLL